MQCPKCGCEMKREVGARNTVYRCFSGTKYDDSGCGVIVIEPYH